MLELQLQHSSTRRVLASGDAVRLVDAIGTDGFDAAFTDLAGPILPCGQVTSFAFRRDTGPRLVGISAIRNLNKTRHASTPYLAVHWRRDPTNIFLDRNLEDRTCYAVLLQDNDVRDREHRRDCYASIGIRHQVSFIYARRNAHVKISFHRSQEEGAFELEELDGICDILDLFGSLLIRHDELRRPGEVQADQMRRRLELRCPSLTGRERDVCALIAIGLSSEGIALTLGISINTVLTLRRRAYARLRISAQNELMRLLLC